MIKKSRFGQLLLKKGLIDEVILEKALIIQAEEDPNPRALGEILAHDFKIDHHSIFGLLAELYAFRTVEINPNEITEKQIKHTREILSKFDDNFRKNLLYRKVLPYQYNYGRKNTLVVLSADPTEKLIDKIPAHSEFKKYEVVYCKLVQLEELINIIAPQKNEFLELLQEAEQELEEVSEAEEDVDEYALDDEINKSLLVNLFEGALIEAVRKGASDIHIIPYQRSSVDFFFRIDGKLIRWHRQENTSPEAIAAVVKDRANGIDRFERDTAQDGFMQRLVDDHLIRFRVSIIPITSSEYERRFESVVIRTIDDRNVITDLRKLGFQEQAESDFMKAIGKSKGIVLVTGPTGSGKSTTLMAALYQIIDPSINVLTCEDPVEYNIKGARQLKIGGKFSFEAAIRSILRHDPDVVMVGEIRDKITADIAVKLANTGHLTFSTLHTNDAPSAISRLFKMGVETFLLAYAINIIVAQRLVRKLCPECRKPLSKEKYPGALEMGITQEELDKGLIFEAGNGCKKCTGGYKGRVNICEALYFTPEVRKAIVDSKDEIDENQVREIAESQGMLSMLDSGLDRIRNGLTSLEEIAYATSED
ncbi:MAG: Flp pilus assembly complex ATPase component TadA [Candidatus Cloacimonetes bacterium]|nr:Flp pilus assembly complex ATPase component TadA [Candidatus Cloacimonadota bacterium]MCF7813653.1 Flp pilus assembly complex ATPase component TadA [Candidatus Cloacimonadota bacterium]MCF7868332.1 Flp pilus assembly complex ATPase component TadA [Candidatus Cloacimonadota bacterium]MCF7883806.1 Flp pilus assembly complex ATPase component TadA [Candidatus Cloacimonadota bacterium]